MTRALLVLFALAVMAAPAAAQARRTPARAAAPRRVELGIGGGLGGGLSLGARDASLLSNNTAGSPFRLFATDTRLSPAAVVEGRVGYRLTPRLMLEAAMTVGWPQLTTALSADAESAPSVDATENVTEYVITGGAVWRFLTGSRHRWTPFVSGGAGVARDVHEGQSLIESGVDGYVGGGLIYPLGSGRASAPRSGLRLDGRLHLLSGGVAEGAGLSPRGVITGSIFVTF
jgi:hypothetical protein